MGDVFYIIGLLVYGSPILCNDFKPEKIFFKMLGDDNPNREAVSYYVKKTWLSWRFERVRAEDIQYEESGRIWLPRYASTYLLLLMGTLLFPEKHKHTVFLGYQLFLTD